MFSGKPQEQRDTTAAGDRIRAAAGGALRSSLPSSATPQELDALSRPAAGPRPELRVLVVDDDASVRKACAEIATSMGFTAEQTDSIPDARNRIEEGNIDIVLLDLRFPQGSGLALLEEVRVRRPRVVVVVVTAFATVNSVVEAMRIGADDYLTKPFTLEELSTVLDRAAQRRVFDLESRSLREKLRAGKGMGSLVGHSPAMEKLYRILSKVAYTNHPVLILGESGTGKELIARSIHANGPNAARPFIPVDCGSLVPSMMESELFGTVRGTSPHVNLARPSLLVAADHGTVFLDEIAELPLDLQAKLLRALQEREVRPVGATQALPVSARVIAATNRDLAALVESGRFRKDLYFRLNVVNLRVPPLRERRMDIPLLAAHILQRIHSDNGLSYSFSDEALRLLMEYDWPGNVRELEHAIERACALSSGPLLHRSDFPTQVQDFRLHSEGAGRLRSGGLQAVPPLNETGTYEEPRVLSIAELERQAILNTIRQLKGDKILAAKLLGIGKTTLYRKLKEYGIAEDSTLP